MQTILFALNAILPIILMILLGWCLRRIGLLSEEFLNVGNKLTFRVFLPVLLFFNVYGISGIGDFNWTFVLYAVAAVGVVFLVATLLAFLLVKDRRQKGVVAQSMYRSNFALIGVPLATMLCGAEGAATASVLSAFAIPLFNILAVITLTMFAPGENNKINPKKMLLGIVKNPLIIGVACGLVTLLVRALFVKWGIEYRISDTPFLYTSIKYVANMATPFALIVLGGKFRLSSVSHLWKPIVACTIARTVIVPLFCLGVAYFAFPEFTGAHFAAYVAAFGTPVAVSSAVMAKEMGSDDELAGQLVVWTSVASAFSVFITVVILRAVGVF